MAIVDMLKLKLFGVRADKQKILDCLFDTRFVQLKTVDEIENTSIIFDEQLYANLDKQKARVDRAIEIIQNQIELNNKKAKLETVVDVDNLEFKNIVNFKDKFDSELNEIDNLINLQSDLKKQTLNYQNKINQLMPFLEVKESFEEFKSTKYVTILLGTIAPNLLKDFDLFLKDCPLTTYQVAGSEGNIIKVFSHKTESFIVTKKLAELGFVPANFNIQTNASEEIKNCEKEIRQIESKQKEILLKFCSYESILRDLKIMSDYLHFCLSKEQAENMFRSTSQVFVLEGYLPKDKKDKVEKSLTVLGNSVEFEICEVGKNEMPPTITKNSKVVEQFEFVTNMYSPPHYRELDPNAFIAFFFSVFFGFIMADIGYGIVLAFGGFLLALKQKRKTGFKSLMNVIAIGGLFTIVFGLLFGSFFGLSHESWHIIPVAVIPNPVDNVILLLVACLGAGVFQIMVSFFLKGILLIKRKKVLQAFLTGFTWDIFFVGLVLFALDFAGVVKGLQTIGLILAVIGVGVSVVGLFITSKGFEKVSKSFGSLYGIINLFSDILSYARLFGLMLSGAIIASIVNDLSASFFNSLTTSIIGVVILLIGHSFNLAMGALGAYIHVARLQYIEFFSRFYEGEGELFVPFGTDFKYVNLI